MKQTLLLQKLQDLFAPLAPKETVTLNGTDDYAMATPHFDLAHGCVVIGDIAVDLGADIAVDTAADIAADSAADVIGDVTADSLADAAADAVEDAAADAVADAAADTAGGVSEATISKAKLLFALLGGALIQTVVEKVSDIIKQAISGGGGKPLTSADIWKQLYDGMVKDYPCDTPAGTACPNANDRKTQEAIVIQYAMQLGKISAQSAEQAVTFEKKWDATSIHELKAALQNISNTGGIPSMIKYMETYTNAGASGAPLVIAAANTALIPTIDFVFSD
ncbi:MAG: hypothetical protein WCR52_07205 [Bacteroidota bacterium]